MKTFLILLLLVPSIIAQEFKAVNVKGSVQYRSGTSEVWAEVKEGAALRSDDFVTTGAKSSVQIKNSNNIINLEEFTAVSISSIKTMSTDDLLLALAMEDMINAPKPNGKNNSSSTAVYGNKEGQGKNPDLKADDFGIKRLNGAIQLAENGFKESAVVFAKETYRKYPDLKQIPSYRIFFADILYEKGLYEESLGEYMYIAKLDLSKEEKSKVESQIQSINKILLNN
ncbi:MAG: hypothetical protein MUE93_02895 [Ignavibacteriaceae bacterium]|jgi:hypothetical protein|nr:hypothetical protein [Ignavibacteriaceae bacterium]MCU0364600.1 hypothetical protein [Ignavibacteriaceae bacterium]MCU0405951.1 hypothetical protein [Ignavibacteriaceae bacterium]MCU0413962.1 hypothetical protein [Ignavibacteriaceae bacterium]